MISLSEIRQRYPSARDLSDGQIIGRLSELTGTSYEEVASRYGFTQDSNRGALGAANDWVIEGANAAAGLVKSGADMVGAWAPGMTGRAARGLSTAIDENVIQPGWDNQSVPTQLAKRERDRAFSSDNLGTQVGGALRYMGNNPMLALSQAAGSFVPLGTGIKAVEYGARGLGATAQGAARAGLATGAVASGAAAGGDAAGSAFQIVMDTPWETLAAHPQARELLSQGMEPEQVYETLATRAARRASVVPAAVGAVAGATGAERALSTGTRGVMRTIVAEAAGEGFEEGVTQFSGQYAGSEYDPSVNPMRGVAGAATMGAGMGAGIATPVALANRRRPQHIMPEEPGVPHNLLDSGMGLESYGPSDGPLYTPGAAPQTVESMYNILDRNDPTQRTLFDDTGAPTYAADPSFGNTDPNMELPYGPELDATTSLGASDGTGGIPFTQDIDTRGLSLAPTFENNTLDMFEGAPTPNPVAQQQAPDFALESPVNAEQMALDFTPPEQAPQFTNDRLNQKGTTGQLPFESRYPSPRAQQVWGVAEALEADGVLSEGDLVQLDTLLTRSRFGEAAKIVDKALRDKRALDKTAALAAKVMPQEQNVEQVPAQPVQPPAAPAGAAGSAAPVAPVSAPVQQGAASSVPVQPAPVGPIDNAAVVKAARPAPKKNKVKSDAIMDEVRGLETQQRALLTKAGRAPVKGTKKADEWDRLEKLISTKKREWDAADRAENAVPDRQEGMEVTEAERQTTTMGEAEQAAIVDEVDNAKGEMEYETAVQRLYDASVNDFDTPLIDKYLEDNAKDKAFMAAFERAESRDNETLREVSKRGLQRLGKAREGTKSTVAKETVEMLTGWWTRKRVTEGRQPGGISEAELNAAVKDVERAIGRKVDIVVADAPADVGLTDPNASGAVHEGKLYLFRKNIPSGVEGQKTLFHELLHMGLRKALTAPEYFRLTNKMYLNSARVRQGADAWMASQEGQDAKAEYAEKYSNPNDALAALRAHAVDEALARISEDNNANPGVLRQIGNWLANVAERLGLNDLAKRIRQMGKSELERFVHDAVMAGASSPSSLLFGGTRYRTPTVNVPSVDQFPGKVKDALGSLKDWRDAFAIRAMFTEDLVNRASKVLPSAKKYKAAMDKIEVTRSKEERQVASILTDFRALPANLQGTGPGSVNGLIKESTMNKKWAFQPTWLESKVEVDPKLAARFNEMPPAAQAVIKRVFEHGYNSMQAMKRAALNNVASEYDVLIAHAKSKGDTVEVEKLEKQKADQDESFRTLFDMSGYWPYAPLKRFGKHVVMGISKAYADARDNGDVGKMRELESNGDHYFVAFAETKSEAKTMRAKIAPHFHETGTFEKLDQSDSYLGSRDVLGAFLRLRTLINRTDEGDAASAKVDQMMRQMYLTLLSETSARKSELHRRNIAGADDDMMRSFATQGRAVAHFIAGMETNGEVNELLQNMEGETRKSLGDRDEKQAYFNEIMRRHTMNLEYSPSGGIEKAMSGTSVYMLLTNPSYFLINATQPWLMSHPLMAAKHGWGNAAGQLYRAYRDLVPVIKGVAKGEYGELPDDVKQAIEDLANRGAIDISLESVLGRFESASDSPTRHFDTVMQKLSGTAQTVESLNRIGTAMAAYRMELAKGASHAQAVDYANKVIYETHGDYSGFNAPRLMRRGVGKLATQFRKFQLIQLSMYARLLNRAFAGASPEEKAVARRALAFNFGTMMAAGGLMGMPGFAAISWLIGKAIPGDDEPDDPEATLRRMFGSKEWADLFLKGAPKLAGVDVSGRIGAGGMLSLLPYTDIDISREGVNDTTVGLLGPFMGGLVPRVADGISLMGQGQYWKGLEQLLPSGISNGLKGWRVANEGVTKRNGDVVMSPDDINFLEGIAQAIGLPSNKITDRNFLANAQFKADEFYTQRTSQLKRAYSDAYRKNDAAAMREAIQDWQDTQAARRKLGYATQPLSALLKSPAEQRKREANTKDGVAFRKNNARFTEELTE